jgi:hypothetical protein
MLKVENTIHGKINAFQNKKIYLYEGDNIMVNILAVAGPNSKYKLLNAKPAGFLAGFWHGLITPITFTICIFNPNICIYETNNSGRLYDFGFIIGVSISIGGSGSRTGR